MLDRSDSQLDPEKQERLRAAIAYNARQQAAIQEMSIIVEAVSRMPQRERDFSWWQELRHHLYKKYRIDSFKRRTLPGRALPIKKEKDRVDGYEDVSDRMIDVLRLLADGLTVRQIARELGVSDNTAKTHVHRIHKRFAARSSAQAVAIALRVGLIE
jgi:DNA-binding NarL/FixJ family response regulator